jgi:hypothetical protein
MSGEATTQVEPRFRGLYQAAECLGVSDSSIRECIPVQPALTPREDAKPSCHAMRHVWDRRYLDELIDGERCPNQSEGTGIDPCCEHARRTKRWA